jgi:hypothetical protein
VTLPGATSRPGWWTAEVALEPDELRADDRRLVVWHAEPPAAVRAAASTGPFVQTALTVLRAGGRVRDGADVTIDERPGEGGGARSSIVLPPLDPSLVGEVNRALAARGSPWRFGPPGTPGMLEGEGGVKGIPVRRRVRLVGPDSGTVVARVNGEPWAVLANGLVVLGSRLDTAWTALPVLPAFVPFLDALVNQVAHGEAPIVAREGAPRVEFRVMGPDTLGATVYGPDPRESDLTAADAAAVREALGGDVRDEGELAAAAFAGAGRTDVTGAVLLLALLLAMGELAVATIAR